MARRAMSYEEKHLFTTTVLQVGVLSLVGGFTGDEFANLLLNFRHRLTLPPQVILTILTRLKTEVEDDLEQRLRADLALLYSKLTNVMEQVFNEIPNEEVVPSIEGGETETAQNTQI